MRGFGLLRAHKAIEQAHRYAGPQGVKRVDELAASSTLTLTANSLNPNPNQTHSMPRWCDATDLLFALEPESSGTGAGRLDHVAITSASDSVQREYKIPTIIASWNVLKSDFLTTRWLAHAATNGEIPETGFYSDTLDYANYGSRYSALVLAQRALFDVLDKIAVAATDYLKLPKSRQIYFGTRRHVLESKRSRKFAAPLRWQPQIDAEVAAGNRSLIALAELAHDYATGYRRSKKERPQRCDAWTYRALRHAHRRSQPIISCHREIRRERIWATAHRIAAGHSGSPVVLPRGCVGAQAHAQAQEQRRFSTDDRSFPSLDWR